MPKNTTGSAATTQNTTAADFMAAVFALDTIPLDAPVTAFDLKLVTGTKDGK